MQPYQPDLALLGNFEQEYRMPRKSRMLMIIGILVITVIVVGIGLLILTGTSSGKRSDQIAGYVLLIICVLVDGLLIWMYLRRRNGVVQIYTNGIKRVYTGKTHVILWRDIQELYANNRVTYVNGIPVRTSLYTLKTADGRSLKLDQNSGDIAAIARVLEQQTLNALYPKARDFLAASSSNMLPFGNFQLTREHLSYKQNTLYLSELGQIRVNQGMLEIFKVGQKKVWAREQYFKIPNAHLLIYLLNQLGSAPLR